MMTLLRSFILQCMLGSVLLIAVPSQWYNLTIDYFLYKKVQHVTYLNCDGPLTKITLATKLHQHDIRVAAWDLSNIQTLNFDKFLVQWDEAVGVVIGDCDVTADVLDQASQAVLFDATHKWLVFLNSTQSNATTILHDYFGHLNLSVDAEICAAIYEKSIYKLYDVFNFGKIQGNGLEVIDLGTWDPQNGLNIYLKEYKYQHRRDFHNLTFRTVTVVADSLKEFSEEKLAHPRFNAGVSLITKIAFMVLTMLKEPFNFRYNYTVLNRWIGSPGRNSTPAATNTLFWKEQDVACTCTRIFPTWLQWVDPIMPPLEQLQLRIFYLIPNKGVGEYENRFLTPLSPAVWWTALGAGATCVLVLMTAAAVESRRQPAQYALFSVLAAVFQQDYNDGGVEERISSQGRRATLLVIGVTSMLLYNYYTSSVVSWLLSAAAPTIDSIEALIQSDLELIFEDVGYARQWIYNPGPFYLSGYKNTQEERLRSTKANIPKRTVPPLQTIEDGVALVLKGGYALNAEPYTVSQVISRTFNEQELCELGSLPMIKPGDVFILTQKRSPYKQFFVWSLTRLLESGLIRCMQRRIRGEVPPCSGRVPRALALGQAAPAFLVLLTAFIVSLILLIVEILHYRYRTRL